MTCQYVHFDRATGRIREAHRGRTVDLPNDPMLSVGHHDCDGIHPNTHRVDVTTLELLPDGAFRAHIITIVSTLTVDDVRTLRSAELRATDDLMRLPPDHPEADHDLAPWRNYRQALRDLGASADAAAMIRAWPKRPDGLDAVGHLRLR